MPAYTIRWANRSHSNQDWQISNGDNFSLRPDYVRNVNVTINNDYSFGISVTTDRGVAAATLTYTAATQTWALNSFTPNEWRLAVGNNIVTVRCFLEDVDSEAEEPQYVPSEPILDSEDPT